MKKFTFLTLIIAFLSASSFQSIAQTTLYSDGFDDMTPGEYLALNDDSGFWTTWDDAPGTSTDAFISDEQSASPSNSVKVFGDQTTDLILKLGNKTSGKYQVDFKLYVSSESPYIGGYYNFQHFESPGVEWAFEVYLDPEGNGTFSVGGADYVFTFAVDAWVQFSHIIDLDNDLAQCFIGGTMVHEWPFSYEASGTGGTNQLGGVDFFAAGTSSSTSGEALYYFDDVEFIELVSGSVAPIIDVETSPIVSNLETGETETVQVNMGNAGEDDLVFNIFPSYELGVTALEKTPAGENSKYPKTAELNATAKANPSPVSQPDANREDVLRYDDGVNYQAIGNAADQEWRVAAHFPPDMVQPFIGMEITRVSVYINDLSLSHKLQIYGVGVPSAPGPGALLYEQDFSPVAASWNDIVLDVPLVIDGQDLWVGYWFDKPADIFTPGCDAGPAHPEGDWLSHGVGWSHLYDPEDPEPLNYNWNIAAYVEGEAIAQWLSISPMSGTLVQDEYIDLDVTFDATQVEAAGYQGKINIINNDPNNEHVKIIAAMVVIVGIDENGVQETVTIYPNPASDVLRFKGNANVTHFRLTNTLGQIVIDSEVNATTGEFDISTLAKGTYIVSLETANGNATQQIIIE